MNKIETFLEPPFWVLSKIQWVLCLGLSLAFITSLPGLYLYTESTQSPSGADVINEEMSSPTIQSESVSVPDDLKPSDFTLQELSKAKKKDVLNRLKIDINSASNSELQRIKGVGPSTAKRIMEYRNTNGGFSHLSDLLDIKGIGEATLEKLSDQIRIETEGIAGNKEMAGSSPNTKSNKINVNKAGESALQTLDGVGPATAEAIRTFREENGDFGSYSELKEVDGIGPATVKKIKSKSTLGDGIFKPVSAGSDFSGGSININTAGSSELEKLKGIGPVTAKSIIQYRSENGSFEAFDDLKNVSGIGPATVEDIRADATIN